MEKNKYSRLKTPNDIANISDKDLRLKSFMEQIRSDDFNPIKTICNNGNKSLTNNNGINIKAKIIPLIILFFILSTSVFKFKNTL